MKVLTLERTEQWWTGEKSGSFSAHGTSCGSGKISLDWSTEKVLLPSRENLTLEQGIFHQNAAYGMAINTKRGPEGNRQAGSVNTRFTWLEPRPGSRKAKRQLD